MRAEVKQRIEQIQQGRIPQNYKKENGWIIPLAWCFVKDNELFSFIRNGFVGTVTPFYTTKDKGVPYLQGTNIKDGKIILTAAYFVTQEFDKAHPNSRLKFADVVIIQSGNVGEAAVIENDFDGGNCHALIIMTPIKKVDSYWQMYLLNSPYKNRLLGGLITGNTLHHILASDMKKLMIPYPSEDERKQIINILMTQDRVIALREKLLAEKLRRKQYLIQVLLTGKKRLPGLNGKWKVCRLDEVLCERKEKTGERDLRICSVAVHEGVVDQLEHLGRRYAAQDTSNYAVVHYGDIVYTKSPTGDFPFGIIKQSFLQELVAVSPLYGVFIPANFWLGQLLHMYFQSAINTKNYLLPIMQKGAKNTINISNQTFLSNKLYLPMEAEEQEAIAKIFLTIEREITLLEQVLIQERRKKKALMQLLLSGIVRVKP